jgi:hypothetical protein
MVMPAAPNDEFLGNLLMRDIDTVTVQLDRPVIAYEFFSGYAMFTSTSFTTGCRTSESSPSSPSLAFELIV